MSILADRISKRLEATGQTARSASLRAGLGADAIRNILTGRSGSPKVSTLRALAHVLDTTIPYLAGAQDEPTPKPSITDGHFVDLPVIHTVAAGPWHAMDDYVDEEPEMLTVPTIPGYEGFRQWIERVRGDSFNQFIADGSYVHVVDAIDMHYEPRDGDIVVVTRSRAQGALVERTLKQVGVAQEGILLFPRSHNPKWSKPLIVTDGLADNEDDVEVRIAGRVLRAFLDFTNDARWK